MENLEKTAKFVVLGTACKKCNDLEDNVKKALANLNIDESVDHITDFVEIAKKGVMTTPALMINNKIVSTGQVLSQNEIEKIISKNLN